MNAFPLAISPCPNDTFLFHGWLSNHVGKNLPAAPTFADIQTLNEWALKGTFPLIKVSFGCVKEIIPHYQILPIGCALGFNCGPKLIAKKKVAADELLTKRIALPGRHTTANLLLERLFGKPSQPVFCKYNEIFDLLDSDQVDGGLIIHESRFTYAQKGYYEIADLGTEWHNLFSLPLPLGALAIKKDLSEEQKEKVVSILNSSLAHGQKHPNAGIDFIQNHSQEKNLEVIEAHIALYVNEETKNLSELGVKAIETLLDLDRKNWLYLPSCET